MHFNIDGLSIGVDELWHPLADINYGCSEHSVGPSEPAPSVISLNLHMLTLMYCCFAGSAISQRFYLYHKKRCVGLVLLSLAYQVPTDQPFDLDEQNKLTAGRFGYPQWEYWNFFTAPDAPKLMEADPSRMYEVNHGLYPSNIPEENGRDVWMREVRHLSLVWWI